MRSQAELAADLELPPWLGDPAFHRSHRSALRSKDPAIYAPLFPDDPDGLPYVWPASDPAPDSLRTPQLRTSRTSAQRGHPRARSGALRSLGPALAAGAEPNVRWNGSHGRVRDRRMPGASRSSATSHSDGRRSRRCTGCRADAPPGGSETGVLMEGRCTADPSERAVGCTSPLAVVGVLAAVPFALFAVPADGVPGVGRHGEGQTSEQCVVLAPAELSGRGSRLAGVRFQEFGAALHCAGGAEVPCAGQRQVPVLHGAVEDRRGGLPAGQYRAETRSQCRSPLAPSVPPNIWPAAWSPRQSDVRLRIRTGVASEQPTGARRSAGSNHSGIP